MELQQALIAALARRKVQVLRAPHTASAQLVLPSLYTQIVL
jgi:hypothetical protein